MIVYVQIAVNVPAVSGVFDYHLPPELEGRLGLGHLVRVPFGAQVVQGVVLEFIASPSVPETKAVIELVDDLPVMTPAQIELARSLADETLNPLAAIIDLMIPPGLSQHADVEYSLPEPSPDIQQDLNPTQRSLLNLLGRRGPLRGRQIDRALPKSDWRRSAQSLTRRGLLKSRSVLPPPTVRPKTVRTVQLAVSPETAEATMSDLGSTPATQARREKALRFLVREPEAVEVAWAYAESGCNLADLQILAERGLVVLGETEVWRDPLAGVQSDAQVDRYSLSQAPPLTADQKEVWTAVEGAFSSQDAGEHSRPFLLHGVTGSGKTEIYLRAVAETLRRRRQAIVLVPEIALTPQTVRRFLARFPGQVGLIHSRLSPGERYDTWRRARAGLFSVLIGPRSALFTPFPRLGLVVLDECHDGSYYQSEPPFYHAVTSALAYARLSGAVAILGSATPLVSQRYSAEVGHFRLAALPRRVSMSADGQAAEVLSLPPVEVVDMRAELKSGNRGIFSRALLDGLDQILRRSEQAILFLNRRGTATYVFCRDCGHALHCPRCDTPMTYHSGSSSGTASPRTATSGLLCHRCNYTRKLPDKCPQCGSRQIRQYGLGSERVEEEVRRQFPKARTLRWDWETTREKDAHEIILGHFAAHRADVLVGTQMLAKGLDLPKVTLVGAVLADVGLHLPDPFAYERVFQVLTQVAGRAGRSGLGGSAILQTFHPENEIILAAAGHEYEEFYRQELQNRRQLGYPPFARLVRLEYRDSSEGRAQSAANALADQLKEWIASERRLETELIGPVPCFFRKLSGQYRWQLILRGPDPASLLRERLPASWRIEVDPVSLL